LIHVVKSYISVAMGFVLMKNTFLNAKICYTMNHSLGLRLHILPAISLNRAKCNYCLIAIRQLEIWVNQVEGCLVTGLGASELRLTVYDASNILLFMLERDLFSSSMAVSCLAVTGLRIYMHTCKQASSNRSQYCDADTLSIGRGRGLGGCLLACLLACFERLAMAMGVRAAFELLLLLLIF
jgi:hypothetical protein